MKRQFPLLWLILAAFALLTGGCASYFSQITPTAKVPENDSGIYTFGFAARALPAGLIESSVKAHLVVNGETYRMARDPAAKYLFSYDYRMPSGQREAKYYFVLEYDYVQDGMTHHAVHYSATGPEDIRGMRLINRYPIQLVTTRGPVGTTVPLVGRGFSQFDKIVFGGQEVPTVFESPTSLRFTVPSVASNQLYPVHVRTGLGDLGAGNFRVDTAELSVLPTSLNLARGAKDLLVFTINFEAPEGGVPLEVTTNVPASVIMPEVIIPAGAKSVSVPVAGGEPGQGVLFIEPAGFNPVRVPVTVY